VKSSSAKPSSQSAEEESDAYFVYASINNNSDDCSFLVTALCELDKLWNLSSEVSSKNEGQAVSQSTDEATTKQNKHSGLAKLIKYAIDIEQSMKVKGTTKIAIKPNMTLKEARLVVETFYKAYDKEIPPMQLSTETITALSKIKILAGVNIAQQYSSLCNRSEVSVHRAAPQLGQGPLIKLSQDQLQMTICKQSGSSIKIDSISKKLISHRKY